MLKLAKYTILAALAFLFFQAEPSFAYENVSNVGGAVVYSYDSDTAQAPFMRGGYNGKHSGIIYPQGATEIDNVPSLNFATLSPNKETWQFFFL